MELQSRLEDSLAFLVLLRVAIPLVALYCGQTSQVVIYFGAQLRKKHHFEYSIP